MKLLLLFSLHVGQFILTVLEIKLQEGRDRYEIAMEKLVVIWMNWFLYASLLLQNSVCLCVCVSACQWRQHMGPGPTTDSGTLHDADRHLWNLPHSVCVYLHMCDCMREIISLSITVCVCVAVQTDSCQQGALGRAGEGRRGRWGEE
jgi:hypothetical protein